MIYTYKKAPLQCMGLDQTAPTVITMNEITSGVSQTIKESSDISPSNLSLASCS